MGIKLLLVSPDAKINGLLGPGAAEPAAGSTHIAGSREFAALDALERYHAGVIEWDRLAERPADFVGALRLRAPQLPLIAIVATRAMGLAARQAGADEVLVKPIDTGELRTTLKRLVPEGRSGSGPTAEGGTFVTQSAAMANVLAVAWRVAPTPASVLLLGENGTGKSRLAHAIHERSARCLKPFVNVNCPCLQPQLLESELFGHVRGAFTGAVSDAPGKVAAAEGGTLFLDEVGELPVGVQAKLLRLLQERCYERVGEARTRRADIRVIAATNRDLRQLVADGRFREDLFYRLNVISIEMPALRSRPEDIVLTAEQFVDEVSRSSGRRRQLTLAARDALLAHAWPGNLRELRNVIERAAILCDREWLDAADFGELAGGHDRAVPQVGEFVTVDALIEAHIRQVMVRAESYEQAARILGIDKSTLYRWRKRLDGGEAATVEKFAG
jgi:NtrC-family two-component system response regulator AlgB